MKAVFVITCIWVLCSILVLQKNTCAAVRSSSAFHNEGIFVRPHDHLESNEAARDIAILTDKPEVKQSTRDSDNYKVYSSSSHGGKYMEIERRKLIYHVDYGDPTTYPTVPSDASWPP